MPYNLPCPHPRPVVLAAFAAIFLFQPLSSQPVDNPVATHYGAGVYDWTDDIAWNQTFSILDYGGDNTGASANDAAYVAARDAAETAGGGVVYFPTGQYRFDDSIGLVDNVVLRGDTPTIADATDPDYRPPSKLVFPQYIFDPLANGGTGTDPSTAFKGIGMSGSGINTGLVHLDVSRASVFAGGYGSSSENIVIFGIRSNNVASEQPWTVPTANQEPWQIHPYRFASNISAFAYRNVLVANCMLNDAHYWLHRQDDGKDMTGAPTDLASLEIDDFEEPGYLLNDGGVWKTHESIAGEPYVFEYTDHYGINVQGSTGEWGAPPWVQPNLFYGGAVIRDNWVYTTMRVKIDSSGRGLVVKDNILKDRQGKTRWYDPNGEKRVGNSATLENRGIDWRGHDVLIEGNEIEVFRHLLNGGPYSSVDGEGILHQEVHGSTIDGLTIRDNTVNAYIGIYKMPYTRNVVIEGNTLTGPAYIQVESDTNGSDFPMYNVEVFDNNLGSKGIQIRADYYSPGVVSANVYNNLLDGTLEIEDHAIHSGNTKLDGTTPATLDTKTGAVAIDPPAEGILYADADPDELTSGQTTNFTVLVTTPSVDVERVKFYRHKTLMGTDEDPPYTFEYVSDGSRALWSAEIEQPQQTGGFDLYTALLVDPDPAWAGPPLVVMTGPDPAGPFVAPATLNLSAAVTPGTNPVDRVEFYAGGSYLGEGVAGSPDYTFSWTGVALGFYSVTAKVWDTAGAVVVSDPVVYEVSGPPDGAPSDLEAVPYSDTEIDLSWADTASNSAGFEIQRSPAGAGSWSVVDSVTLPDTSYRDSGLSAATAYDYRVLATNTYGSGDPSGTATATTFATAGSPPSAPGGFSASALNADRILLTWTAASGTPFGYVIESRFDPGDAWSPLGSVAATSLEYRQTGLSADTRVFYRIRAWNNAGDSTWTETTGATLSTGFAVTFSAEGDPWPIPGRIEFTDYNPGAYYDTSSGNEGSSDYRFPDSVDIGGATNNPTIGWIANGEWLEFSVRVEQAGLYDVVIHYASPNTSGSLSLKLDGENIAPAVTFANTGAWGTYQDHTISNVYLPGGHYTLRSYVENSGFNLDYVEFTLTGPANYSNWQQTYLSGHSMAGAGENADGDVYDNIFDRLLGLDPLAHDPIQTSVAVEGGTVRFRFPLAKGLGTDWSVLHSEGLLGGLWPAVAEESITVLSEDPDRIWLEAEVPEPAGGEIFFRLEASP